MNEEQAMILGSMLATGTGGGGGGGDVTGVKGAAETNFRKGNVSISPANIGLGNVNNTADADKPISSATQTALNGKVDKVTGKALSTNDYTNEDKAIVDGVTGALADKVDKVTGKGLSTNDLTDLRANKLDGLANIKSVGSGLSLDDTTGTLTATGLSGKADKVSNATNGNFAGLDANGNLTDSGKAGSDFAPSTVVSTTTTDPGVGSALTTNNLLIVIEE